MRAPDPGSFSRIYPAVQPRRPWEDTAETLFSCLPQVTGSVSPELSSHVPEGGTSIKLSTLTRGQADHHAGTSIPGPAGNITREPLAQTPGATVLSDTPFLSQATCSMSCGRERGRFGPSPTPGLRTELQGSTSGGPPGRPRVQESSDCTAPRRLQARLPAQLC